jgi:hypothetical protein
MREYACTTSRGGKTRLRLNRSLSGTSERRYKKLRRSSPRTVSQVAQRLCTGDVGVQNSIRQMNVQMFGCACQTIRTRRGLWSGAVRRGATSDIECRCLDVSATFNQLMSATKLSLFKKVREFLESAERSLIWSDARHDEYGTCTGCKRARSRRSHWYVRRRIARTASCHFFKLQRIVSDGRQRAFDAPYDCVSYETQPRDETSRQHINHTP